jgi:DNA processing protein
MNSSCYPQWAYAAALAALPLQTPRRLRRLVELAEPSVVWAMLQNGERPLVGIDPVVWRAWHGVSASLLDQTADKCITHNVTVATIHDGAYPTALIGDPSAPAVLFMIGDTSALSSRRVGVIGTRTATRRGRHFARRLGEELANESVCVVSGLARGIDVESHVGALAATLQGATPPVAVVASGPDVVYPREHAGVWAEVAERGLIVSESPPGVRPETHRFPMRNRVIAALSEVLVVVESRTSGGSMITVREAMKRDITVMAVPGAVDVTSSEGTNMLLRDGCAPVMSVDDVLMALGLDNRRAAGWCDHREMPFDDERRILSLMGHSPRSLDEVALLSARSVVDVAVLLGRLEAKGWVAYEDGWWEALVA